MGNFIRTVNWHHWFNPANRQKALRLAKRTEKRLERNPEIYPVEFYRFWSKVDKLRREDGRERLRLSCGCTSCELKAK